MTDTARHFILRTDRQRQAAAEFILNLPQEPLQEVVVREYRKRRSVEANRFYFGCVVRPLAQHCGYSVSEMHNILLMSYYGVEQREFRGKLYDVPRRRTTTPETTDKIDFMGLIQHGQQVAAELGVRLPDQGTQDE